LSHSLLELKNVLYSNNKESELIITLAFSEFYKLNPDKLVVAKWTCPPMPCGGNPDFSGNQKYLPPRHKDTKDFILLFVLSVLVPLWREEKSFATKSTKFTIKKQRMR